MGAELMCWLFGCVRMCIRMAREGPPDLPLFLPLAEARAPVPRLAGLELVCLQKHPEHLIAICRPDVRFGECVEVLLLEHGEGRPATKAARR